MPLLSGRAGRTRPRGESQPIEPTLFSILCLVTFSFNSLDVLLPFFAPLTEKSAAAAEITRKQVEPLSRSRIMARFILEGNCVSRAATNPTQLQLFPRCSCEWKIFCYSPSEEDETSMGFLRRRCDPLGNVRASTRLQI